MRNNHRNMTNKLFKISSLPEEMLLEIFSFIPAEDLISNVSKVCSEWNALILGSGCIWNNITLVLESTLPISKFKLIPLEFNEFTVDELHQVPNIRSVKIYNFSNQFAESSAGDNFLTFMRRNCRRVEIIEVLDWRGLPTTFFSVLHQCYPRLKVLELRCNMKSYSLLSAFHNLKTLGIYSHDFRSRDLKAIAGGKASLQKFLVPRAGNLSDESLAQFLVAKSASLEVLCICGYDTTDVGYQALGECTRLRELYVSHACKMGPAGLDALAQLPCLRKLTLNRATFTSQVLSNWLQTSPAVRKLQRFDMLFYTNWEDSIMAKLVEARGTSPNIKNLLFVRKEEMFCSMF